MIDNTERYRRVTEQMTFFANRIRDNFKVFIQLSLATIGGFIWLRLQERADHVADLLYLARWILPALALFMSVLSWLDFWIWLGYRREEARLVPEIQPPTLWKQGWQEFAFTAAMAIVGTFGYFFLR
jgi:hypothetical protein